MTAPYETAVTAGFAAFGETIGFLDKISPALVDFILKNTQAHEGIKEQRIMDRRIRKCSRLCRKGNYDSVGILARVAVDFADLPSDQRSNLVTLIKENLKVK